LAIAKQTQGASSIALMQLKLCSNNADISFAAKQWQVFRAVITGVLDDLKAVMVCGFLPYGRIHIISHTFGSGKVKTPAIFLPAP
jgi:hypothetical protein